jgi:hypothetical protein
MRVGEGRIATELKAMKKLELQNQEHMRMRLAEQHWPRRQMDKVEERTKVGAGARF